MEHAVDKPTALARTLFAWTVIYAVAFGVAVLAILSQNP